MPYTVQRKGARYAVVDTESGHARLPTTKAKAARQLQLLNQIERHWTHEGGGVYRREINGQTVRMTVK